MKLKNMDEIRANILELCSESEYGSWEFWLTEPSDRTMKDAEYIVQTIVELVKEKKIYPMEYASVNDRSYKETKIDVDKLRKEVILSINPETMQDSTLSYWFLATNKGKEEDKKIRSKTPPDQDK